VTKAHAASSLNPSLVTFHEMRAPQVKSPAESYTFLDFTASVQEEQPHVDDLVESSAPGVGLGVGAGVSPPPPPLHVAGLQGPHVESSGNSLVTKAHAASSLNPSLVTFHEMRAPQVKSPAESTTILARTVSVQEEQPQVPAGPGVGTGVGLGVGGGVGLGVGAGVDEHESGSQYGPHSLFGNSEPATNLQASSSVFPLSMTCWIRARQLWLPPTPVTTLSRIAEVHASQPHVIVTGSPDLVPLSHASGSHAGPHGPS